MSDRSRRRVAFVGLPEAGKSTYIVAVYEACLANRDGMAITFLGEGQRDYLNRLRQQLANFKSLTRTQQSEPGELDLCVRLSDQGQEMQLVIPDLSGEHLRDALGGEHALDPELHQLLDDVACVLLFVRVDDIRPPEPLVDFNALLDGLEDLTDAEAAPERPDEWTVKLAATEVRLAHAIQELLRLRGERPLRMGIVLSAWDRNPSPGTPDEWARTHLALVTQILDNHADVVWEAFGVSAQGGDFADQADRERLEALTLSQRGQAYGGDGEEVGIGTPIAWALDVDQ